MIAMANVAIDQLLNDSLIGRLGMADSDGRPYSLPFPFCWHQGAIYLRLAMTGRKGSILQNNNQVCFEVDWCAAEMNDYASIIIEGRLLPVTDLSEKNAVRTANEAKYRRLRPHHRPGHGRSTALEDLAMHKIVVQTISGRCMEPQTHRTDHVPDSQRWLAAAPL